MRICMHIGELVFNKLISYLNVYIIAQHIRRACVQCRVYNAAHCLSIPYACNRPQTYRAHITQEHRLMACSRV